MMALEAAYGHRHLFSHWWHDRHLLCCHRSDAITLKFVTNHRDWYCQEFEWFVTVIFIISMIHRHFYSMQCFETFSENCLAHHPDKEQISKKCPTLCWIATIDKILIIVTALTLCCAAHKGLLLFFFPVYIACIFIVQVVKENNQSGLSKNNVGICIEYVVVKGLFFIHSTSVALFIFVSFSVMFSQISHWVFF